MGLNKVFFSGRIRGKALQPARYRAILTANDSVGKSAPNRLTFTIVKS